MAAVGTQTQQLLRFLRCRLLHWAVGAGLPATAAMLLKVVQSDAGSCTAAAGAALRRALSPGGVDPLRLLQLSDQACSAAALHTAARLGCLDGLSLLHRALQVRGRASRMQACVLLLGGQPRCMAFHEARWMDGMS